MTNMHINDQFDLGYDLRLSALDAHGGKLPSIEIAWSFLLDNPECFSDSDEWPEFMPIEPPIMVIAGYYDVPSSTITR